MENYAQTGMPKQYFSINNLFVEKSDIDIFVAAITSGRSPQEELFDNAFPIYPGAAKKFVRFTGLVFVHKNTAGNVCYANNNEDLRDEFKQVFDITDILYYVYGKLFSVGKENFKNDPLPVPERKMPYPDSADEFWETVSKGRDLIRKKV